MIGLTHPVTGHQITTDQESVTFWQSAGYREDKPKKTPAKKAAASSKRSK